MSDSSRPHGLQPTRLLCPWDFPGKSTGVGCHCLLQKLVWPSIKFSNLCLSPLFNWRCDVTLRIWIICIRVHFMEVPTLIYFISYYSTFQRRRWHPTPVLLPGKSHGRRSLVGCGPWGQYESGTTEQFHFHFSPSCMGEGNSNPLQCSYLENSQGRRSLVGFRLLGCTELDTTEAT